MQPPDLNDVAGMTVPVLRVIAAVWAMIFAVLHIVWALGFPIGLGDVGPMTGWFLAYDLAVAVGCLAAVVVALWGRRLFLLVVASVPLLRGLLGITVIIIDLVSGSYRPDPTLWVELFFLVGAALFLLSARSPAAAFALPRFVSESQLGSSAAGRALLAWFVGHQDVPVDR